MNKLYHRIIKEFRGDVYRLCYSRTKNREKAEDLTQKVFVKFCLMKIEKIESLVREGIFKDYLIKIAKNICNDDYKKEQQLKTQPLEAKKAERYLHHSVTQDETDTADIAASNAKYILDHLGKYIFNETNSYIFYHSKILKVPYQEIREELLEMEIDLSVTNLRKRSERTTKKLGQILEERHPNFLSEKLKKNG